MTNEMFAASLTSSVKTKTWWMDAKFKLPFECKKASDSGAWKSKVIWLIYSVPICEYTESKPWREK